MKSALQLCSLAVADTPASPTAGLVMVDRGEMVSYGGLFCIRVPVETDIGCAFNPKSVMPFFRKDRDRVTYTIKNKKLILTEGKEKLTVGCLAVEEMVTLDVIAKKHKATLNVAALKQAVAVVNPVTDRICLAGITFRDGLMYGSDSRIVVSAESGLDDEFPDFCIHHDAAKALVKFKSPVTHVSCDGTAIKFIHKDGTSLSTLLMTETMPVGVNALFDGEWVPTKLSKETIKDLLTIDCERVIFYQGNISYINKLDEGIIDKCVNKQLDVRFDKKYLDVLLKASEDVRASVDGDKLQAYCDGMRIICCAMRG